ncbi:MAG: NADH-quinone oxidoreductase subunit NuoB [Candidatus Moraniibacteriota bacterium]
MLKKIFATPLRVKSEREIRGIDEIETLGKAIKERANKLFGGSIVIREVAAGSNNAEEQELVALTNAYYDVERFGVHFVASPRHADMMFVTGPVSRNMADGLRHTYAAMPTPKWVVAVGDGAIDGGIYRGSYAVYDRVEDVVPVDFKIPGDPPSPKVVLKALLEMLDTIDEKRLNA